MKKNLLILAALLVSAMVAAETYTATISYEKAESTLGNGSYGDYKDTIADFVADGITYSAQNICANVNNTPSGWAAKQFIQVKKEKAGFIINKNAMDLTKLSLTVFSAEGVIVEAGMDNEELEAVVADTLTQTVSLKPYTNKTVGEPVEHDLTMLNYDLTGAQFVMISSSTTLHIYEAVLTYEVEPTAVENTKSVKSAEKSLINGEVIIMKDGVRYNTLGIRK